MINIIQSLTDEHRVVLQRCYDKLPDSYPLDQLEQQIKEGKAFAYEQLDSHTEELLYVGIVQICPAGLSAIVGAGTIPSDYFFLEQLTFMIRCCHHFKVAGIRLTGRRGWYRRFLKHCGFYCIEWFRSSNGHPCGVFQFQCRPYTVAM